MCAQVVARCVSASISLLLAASLACGVASAQDSAILHGQVIDPSRAAVAGAAVTATGPGGKRLATATDGDGRYSFSGLAAGEWNLRVEIPGFNAFESGPVDLQPGTPAVRDVSLQIRVETAKITVADTVSVTLDASQSAGQVQLRGDDLDSLSDDPEDLANELQMLAGPAPGPDGPTVYVDGFTGGRMPPKASIREIRVNQNPFSAEFDKVGFGRIEILTKPGADKFHGQALFDFGNRFLTARNPFLTSPIVPGYQQALISGNFSGALTKKSSFFIDLDRRITDENALVTYTGLDKAFNPIGVSSFLVSPSRRFSVSPRLDYALSPSQTLTTRYSWTETNARNQGIRSQSFDEPSRALSASDKEQTVQVNETAVLGTVAVNDARFQFWHTSSGREGVDSSPEIAVQGAFTGGGTYPHNAILRDRFELQDYMTVVKGRITARFGIRLRGDRLRTTNEQNFNGQYLFTTLPDGTSAIDVYRQNRILDAEGLSAAAIAALGFGPSQFTITTGNPTTEAHQKDLGAFLQGDWRATHSILLSGGMRYEARSQVSGAGTFAPRIGIAWAPQTQSGKPARTVFRAGSGLFYDIIGVDLVLNALQFNGVNQQRYIVRNPAFFPVVDSTALTAGGVASPVRYAFDSALRTPWLWQSAFAVERQLSKGATLSVNYSNTRARRQLRSRDINAPLPTVFDSSGIAAGPRPYGPAGDIYLYESTGSYLQNQLIVSSTAKLPMGVSLFGYYVYSRAWADTEGAGTLPANNYDLHSEWGRASYDNRHRGFISGSTTLPWKIKLAPFVFMQSGRPYNMTSGVDTNGDGNVSDDRPAFATNLSRPSVVYKPGFGVFDISPASLAANALVPRNYLEGPGIFALTVRITRAFSFGRVGEGSGGGGGGDIKGGESIRNSGSQSGLSSVFGGPAMRKRFNLTIGASLRNALNNVNPATPIGNLSSPYFGKSIALNTFGPLPGAGPNAGAGNRHIEIDARLTF